ncbi:TetR/AcrR family transcriptional regulator [Dyella silvae]|uniref:TetR/AcrR family transcriptional regulator n=1 Tax=Dyella silvae TaxID=2994424 RepID=UPI0022643679|nr:TetR/AcrR family transcriptional regulator [Dyella silvae]
MRYPAKQKQETRARLLAAASMQFKKKGYVATTIDELMQAIGLTGGAFYAHFDSKDAIFAELIEKDLAWSRQLLGAQTAESREQWVTRVLDTYLSVAHVRNPELGCAIPALAEDVARATPKVRRAFETSLLTLHQQWTPRFGSSDLAWSVLCQLVGAIVVTRAMDSKDVIESVIQANKDQIRRVALPRSRAGKSRPERGEAP